MPPAEVADLTDEAGRRGRIVGVRLPVVEEDEAPWLAPPSRRRPETPIAGPLPEAVEVVFGDQVYVDRAGLPASLVNRLARLAAFQNPEFYSAQGMRLPTFGIPRVIGCAELLSHHVALPRGCRDQVEALLASLGIVVRPRDERNCGRPVATTFEGELTPEQEAAAGSLLRHDTGVLAATTAFGKTVVAASLIAARRTNTLVLVHRRQLLDQWLARLASFLDRNDLIVDDVLSALGSGRSPIVLTERKGHALHLAERLSRSARNVLVLHGGLGQKARRELANQLESIADAQERVLIATGRYVGEGFDDARLDTLFLTMPISWRGTLAQYAGRLHRIHPAKREVIVYDYVDGEVPVLARMSLKRITGFKSLGYSVATP